MTTTRYTTETANDAGLLREYIAEHYGATLVHGGPGMTYFRAMSLVRQLARLAGADADHVLDDIRSDYEYLADAEEGQ